MPFSHALILTETTDEALHPLSAASLVPLFLVDVKLSNVYHTICVNHMHNHEPKGSSGMDEMGDEASLCWRGAALNG